MTACGATASAHLEAISSTCVLSFIMDRLLPLFGGSTPLAAATPAAAVISASAAASMLDKLLGASLPSSLYLTTDALCSLG